MVFDRMVYNKELEVVNNQFYRSNIETIVEKSLGENEEAHVALLQIFGCMYNVKIVTPLNELNEHNYHLDIRLKEKQSFKDGVLFHLDYCLVFLPSPKFISFEEMTSIEFKCHTPRSRTHFNLVVRLKTGEHLVFEKLGREDSVVLLALFEEAGVKCFVVHGVAKEEQKAVHGKAENQGVKDKHLELRCNMDDMF